MGNLQDELKKRLADLTVRTADLKPTRNSPAVAQEKRDVIGRDEIDWKKGVQQLHPKHQERLASPTPASTQRRIAYDANHASSHRVGNESSTGSPLTGAIQRILSKEQIARDAAIRKAALDAYGGDSANGRGGHEAGRPIGKSTSQAVDFGSFMQPTLARVNEFKYPDKWVELGGSLQAPNSNPRGRVLPVRIGIDFGTAYTKVAIRAADKVFFVTWDGVRVSASPYLLPGEVCLDSAGCRWLGRAPGATEIYADLKLPLIQEMVASKAQERSIVAFLAWIMRYARAWMYEYQPNLLRDRRLAWEVNIGCPTNSWASSSIQTRYRRLASLSWILSQCTESISDEAVDQVLARGGVEDGGLMSIGLDGLFLVPEFVAQIAGYVQSPQRRDGLHMLADIGAGTMDLAVFNVIRDPSGDGDRFPIFASKVCPLGSHFLMHSRLAGLEIDGHGWDDLIATPDRETLEKTLRLNSGALAQKDSEFIKRVTGALSSVLLFARQRKYTRAPEWGTGIPLFLAGGGCNCDVYKTAVMGAFQDLHTPPRYTRFPMLGSERPTNATFTEIFHRLSVAYGLTFDAATGRKILAPCEIPDDPGPRVRPSPREWDNTWQK